MGIFILAKLLFGAMLLMRRGTAKPQTSLKSMTFNVERVDRTADFSVITTTYVSTLKQSYRYDFSGGMSKLYIYPNEGKAYYYYPSSNFPKNEFNITKCLTIDVPRLGDMISPFPSLEGYDNLGPDHVYDIPAEKYFREDTFSDTTDTIWMAQDAAIGSRPVRSEYREYYTHYGTKELLLQDYTKQYYGLKIGEQPSSTWVRPDVVCESDVFGEDSDTTVAMAEDMGVPPALLRSSNKRLEKRPVTKKTYKKGRKSVRFVDDTKDPLVRPFPWNPQQCEKMAKTLPSSYDWRDYGAVTPVKNQRMCGSCWTFGAVGSLEGAYFRKTGIRVSLSEQAMMDCAGSGLYVSGGQSDGCYGGIERSGFTWIHQIGGIPPTAEYRPYQETNGVCSITDKTKLVAQLEGYYHVPNNTDAVRVALVKLGPLVVSIDASNINVVVIGEACKCKKLDHSVLIVGYGESAEYGPYWIVKNSWGGSWGTDGYFLISAKGNCACVLDEVYFPILI